MHLILLLPLLLLSLSLPSDIDDEDAHLPLYSLSLNSAPLASNTNSSFEKVNKEYSKYAEETDSALYFLPFSINGQELELITMVGAAASSSLFLSSPSPSCSPSCSPSSSAPSSNSSLSFSPNYQSGMLDEYSEQNNVKESAM